MNTTDNQISIEDRKAMDKFFTKPEAAEAFIGDVKKHLNLDYFECIRDPAAGDGKLLDQLPARAEGYDLYPEREDIKQGNWFDANTEAMTEPALIVMNPPYGTRSKLAIDFFKHATKGKGVEAIACLIPITWSKYSIHRQIPEDWDLVLSERLPENSFLLGGKDYRVRTCYQLWIRSECNHAGWGGFTDYAKGLS